MSFLTRTSTPGREGVDSDSNVTYSIRRYFEVCAINAEIKANEFSCQYYRHKLVHTTIDERRIRRIAKHLSHELIIAWRAK